MLHAAIIFIHRETRQHTKIITDSTRKDLTTVPKYYGYQQTSAVDVPARSALRASSSGDVVVLRTRRRIGDSAFSVAAPRAWNTLPTQLKLLRSTTTFRRQLKTFLF